MTPPDDLPRTQLGPYRLEELLGRGGMGVVYRAVDERLGRRVAVKHLPESMAVDERRRCRFPRESTVLARLSHPAIVQIFDLLEIEDGDWIVMEFVPGSTLADRIRLAPISVLEILGIGRQVAEGLAAAHDAGVLHRDLKAENVMVQGVVKGSGPVPRVKILDFGLAKLLDDQEGLSKTGQVFGTYSAMSPEQARGGALDHRSDLFSFGVLLYEMCTGQRPFDGASGLEILQQVVTCRHDPVTRIRPEIPEQLSDLVDRLLEKSPEHRPKSAWTVAEELAALLDEPERQDAETQLDDRPTLDLVDDGPAAVIGTLEAKPAGQSVPRGRLLWAIAVLALVVAAFVVIEFWPKDEESVAPESTASEVSPSEIGEEEEADPYAMFQHGMEALERFDKPGRIERAISAFEAALATEPESAPAHAGLALAYWTQFITERDPLRLEQAKAVGERAVRLDEHLALAHVALGTIYGEAGRTAEALEELEVAAILAPMSAEVERGRGVAYREAGEIAEAIAAYQRAVELEPNDRYLRDELGSLFYRQGLYDAAEEQFLRSVEIAPDGIYGYRNLSSVYFAQDRLPEAAEALQDALEIQPDASLYSNLGTIYYSQGLYRAAETAFEKALDHGGANFGQLWANLADAQRMVEGSADQGRRAYLHAIQLLRPRLESQPENSKFQSQLALYLAKSGECSEAGAVLEAASFGDEPVAHYRGAVAREVCGDRGEALVALSAALAAGLGPAVIAQDPELFALRSDPRYHQLLNQD